MSVGRRVGLAAAAVLLAALPAGAQEVRAVRDERVIAEQIRTALPHAVRGYEMLTAATDAAQAEKAVQTLFESYRYLRAAQQGTEMVHNFSTFPDPLLKLRMSHIWQVRTRLLQCVDNKGHLSDPADPIRVHCLEGLPEGIRRLRIIVGTLP